ncbi:MAG: hypothetical protein L7U72_01160, partial [Rubripirellula sp.]|nr:hypothetical protein [Rubripirellula sp.]
MIRMQRMGGVSVQVVGLVTSMWFATIGLPVVDAQVVHFSEDSFDKATFSQLAVLQARQECLDALNEKMERIALV